MNIFLAILVSFVLVACDGKQVQSSTTEIYQAKEQSTELASVKVDVSIIDKHLIPGIKRGLTVRLDKKISKEVLIDVAHKIKQSDPSNYERTLILYLLPNMPLGEGAWASTNFDPELEVRIFGLSLEQEDSLMSHPQPATKGIHGTWIDELSNRRLTIFSNKKGFFMEQLYTDGSSVVVELKQGAESEEVSILREIGRDESDPPYVIGSDGNLYLSTSDGPLTIGIKKQEPVASPSY
jgi:hypothetical protein